VSGRWRRSPQRPFYKGLIDGLVFIVFLALVLLSLQRAGWLKPETGRFVAIDGDSLRKGDGEFRLFGIDAPELQQTCANRMGGDYPCGREAQRALARLIKGHDLACIIRETDRYGRGIADCAAGGVDINAAMVRQGWAIAFHRPASPYTREEAEARKAERGIWQGSFEDPQSWRDAHRGSLVGASLID
jgi:endonuclease YncB( thermonuclease family)